MPPKDKLLDTINIVGDLAELEKIVLDNINGKIDKQIHMILIDAVRRILIIKDGN
ncbi:MAG: hypothetical protein ACKO7N_10390 [Candidatus Nitrosotenuis sp.]